MTFMANHACNIFFGEHRHRATSVGKFKGRTVVVIDLIERAAPTNDRYYSVQVNGQALPGRFCGIAQAREAAVEAFTAWSLVR